MKSTHPILKGQPTIENDALKLLRQSMARSHRKAMIMGQISEDELRELGELAIFQRDIVLQLNAVSPA